MVKEIVNQANKNPRKMTWAEMNEDFLEDLQIPPPSLPEVAKIFEQQTVPLLAINPELLTILSNLEMANNAQTSKILDKLIVKLEDSLLQSKKECWENVEKVQLSSDLAVKKLMTSIEVDCPETSFREVTRGRSLTN